jgi:hypothetical protein
VDERVLAFNTQHFALDRLAAFSVAALHRIAHLVLTFLIPFISRSARFHFVPFSLSSSPLSPA